MRLPQPHSDAKNTVSSKRVQTILNAYIQNWDISMNMFVTYRLRIFGDLGKGLSLHYKNGLNTNINIEC